MFSPGIDESDILGGGKGYLGWHVVFLSVVDNEKWARMPERTGCDQTTKSFLDFKPSVRLDSATNPTMMRAFSQSVIESKKIRLERIVSSMFLAVLGH